MVPSVVLLFAHARCPCHPDCSDISPSTGWRRNLRSAHSIPPRYDFHAYRYRLEAFPAILSFGVLVVYFFHTWIICLITN